MEQFLQLNWGIKEPHELDLGIDFIPEEEIALSYIFSGLDSENKECKVKDELDTAKIRRPLLPGQNFNFKSNIKSFQNTIQQAKCLMALTLLQSCKKPTGFYEQGCMELYNNSHQEILRENAKFLEFAKEDFMKNKRKLFKFKQLLRSYSECLWKHKFEILKHYKQFYKGFDMLPYSYKDDEEPVEMVHVQNLLELGTLARFSGPTLLKPYYLKMGQLPKAKVLYPSNQVVSKDVNINKLIETTKVDVVISSSGLTRLLNFTNTNIAWDIPVVIKEIQFQNSDGTIKTKNVIFIDKPLPNKSPNVFELNKNCAKILLKTNFCDTDAFSFANTESIIGAYHVACSAEGQPKNSTISKQNEGNICCDEASAEGIKTIDNREGPSKKIKMDDTAPKTNINELKNKIHHNVSYRLWKLQLKNEQCELMKTKYNTNSFHVLVRCKLDGCESAENGQLLPLNVIPKMEYHLEYGAGIPTLDDLIKQWVYTFFRPCSQVRRIRMHYSTGEIIAVENCAIQKIALEAQTYYQCNPHLGIGVLYKIVARLLHLTPGNYLLHHVPKDGPFVALLREMNESEDVTYNLYEEYDISKLKIDSNKIKRWHSIDVNYILPRHRALQQMPGMFKPSLVRQYNNKGKLGKNSKKNKKKKNKKKKKIVSVKITD